MEIKIKKKVKELNAAIIDFAKSLSIDISVLDEVVADSVKSGQLQKFEFTVELLWKLIKIFLFEIDGVEVFSPKKSIKMFFQAGYITYNQYELLINMIDDRNLLSHIYEKEMFESVTKHLHEYLKIIKEIFGIINNSI